MKRIGIVLSIICGACAESGGQPSDIPPAAATQPKPSGTLPASPPGPTRPACNAAAADFALGRQISPSLAERARTGARAEVVRVIRPGQEVTLEFLEDRLNLRLDERDVVIDIFCA